MNITCNLYSQWIHAIRLEFDNFGYNHTSMTDHECAIVWQSWRRRIVTISPRQIETSKVFTCPSNLQSGLDELEKAIKNGDDLRPWQSTLIDRVPYEDGLYNDYGIVHFHLGIGKDNRGYINRTGDLLFAIVTSKFVYKLGIYQHGAWYELDLLDIIDENWPSLLDAVTLRDIVDAVGCPDNRDAVRRLRNAHINSIMKLKSNRIIFSPGGGISTDGTSIEAVRAADYWAKILRNGEKVIRESIVDDIRSTKLKNKDYDVILQMKDDEISASADGIYKWILWKKQ